jgi:hypothetical protein
LSTNRIHSFHSFGHVPSILTFSRYFFSLSKNKIDYWTRTMKSLNRQLFILVWKNWTLMKRNKASIGELVIPLVFVVVLCVMRLAIDIHRFDGQNNKLKNLSGFLGANPNRNRILFYPNTDLTMRLINSTKATIDSASGPHRTNISKNFGLLSVFALYKTF